MFKKLNIIINKKRYKEGKGMKKKKICTAFAIACMMLVSGFAAACDGSSISVELSTENNITTLKPGESTQIIMDVENEDIVLDIMMERNMLHYLLMVY